MYYLKYIILILFLFNNKNILAEKEVKIIHQYRKHQKIDVSSLDVSGSYISPGDLSMQFSKDQSFKNTLPYRTNFNREIILGIERIR